MQLSGLPPAHPMLYQLLAIVLVFFPDLAPQKPCEELRLAVREIGYRLELRHQHYQYETWFPYECRTIRDDWLTCKAERWPKLWELERLPSAEWIDRELIQNREFKTELEHHQMARSWHHYIFQRWINKLDYEWRWLDAMQDATSERLEPATRRRALHKLRELVGTEVFYNGGPWETSSHWGEN